MQKKTKHRILGILVVAALVVISLPLFQGKNELASETSLVKAPAFPDQTAQVSDEDISQSTLSSNQDVIPIQQPDSAIPINVANSNKNDQPDEAISNKHQNVMDIRIATNNPTDNSKAATVASPSAPGDTAIHSEATAQARNEDVGTNAIQQETKKIELASLSNKSEATQTAEPVENDKPSVDEDSTPRPVKAKPKKTKIAKYSGPADKIKVLPSSVFTTRINDNGLFEIKNAVWVIQLGSFKNKSNALRLVNQLRLNGYPAFIQKISGTFGESTRVYVGPTTKRIAARTLASKIEKELHVRGVVISYKPLTL